MTTLRVRPTLRRFDQCPTAVPTPDKARVVGAHAVNGTPPPYAWSIGGTRRRQDWAEKPAS